MLMCNCGKYHIIKNSTKCMRFHSIYYIFQIINCIRFFFWGGGLPPSQHVNAISSRKELKYVNAFTHSEYIL